MNNSGCISKWGRWLTVRKQTYRQNCWNGTEIWLFGWPPVVQKQWLNSCTVGSFLQQLLFKGQQERKQPQQLTEESPRCESCSGGVKDETPAMWNQDRHLLEAGAISSKPKWPGIRWDLHMLDELTFIWGKTRIPLPTNSQGITRKDLFKKTGHQTMGFSENC